MFPPKEPTPWNEVIQGEGNVDPWAIALLSGLLRYDPASRLTASQALQEAYFVQEPAAADAEDIKAAVVSIKT